MHWAPEFSAQHKLLAVSVVCLQLYISASRMQSDC